MTKWISLIVVALFLGGAVGWTSHQRFGSESVAAIAGAKNPAEERVLATLKQMMDNGERQFGVPEADGRRLRLLVEAMGATNVVEVGTSTGYSALWLALGALPAGGRVTTFEIDPRRAAKAREKFRQAGVEERITVVVGDAHRTLSAVQAPVDVVFLDADKDGYVDYLNQLLPLLRPGGLIVAHNVEAAPDYFRRVTASRELDTVLLTQGSGMSVTMKKR